MKTLKNLFLYVSLLMVLVLSASSISNGQNGRGNGGTPPAGTNGCAHQDGTGVIDSGGNGSGNGIGGNEGPSCGGPQAAPAATPEPISMLLFGTGLATLGVAARRRRLRGEDSK